MLRQERVEVTLSRTHQHDVARLPRRLQHVHGQVGHGRLERHGRVRRVVFGAEQATFLGRPGGEDHRAVRFCFLLEGTRDLEHAGNADRIVRGTVTDAVAGRIWIAHAIRVPMRPRA